MQRICSDRDFFLSHKNPPRIIISPSLYTVEPMCTLNTVPPEFCDSVPAEFFAESGKNLEICTESCRK